jgi:hypothetical protein
VHLPLRPNTNKRLHEAQLTVNPEPGKERRAALAELAGTAEEAAVAAVAARTVDRKPNSAARHGGVLRGRFEFSNSAMHVQITMKPKGPAFGAAGALPTGLRWERVVHVAGAKFRRMRFFRDLKK